MPPISIICARYTSKWDCVCPPPPPPAVFVVLRLGVCVWTGENVLKTLRLSVIYFEDRETKT